MIDGSRKNGGLIGKTAGVRRTLAGFLFALSYAALCVAAGGLLLQRTVFDPDLTRDAADEVLKEPAILKELTKRIAAATTAEMGTSTIEIEALVNSVAANREGAKIMSDVLHDAHARLIGVQRGPVQISTSQLIQIVRSERVGEVPPLTIPVPRVAALDITRAILKWAVPLAAIAALVLFGLGLAAHPDKASLVRSLGYGLLVLGAAVTVMGYILPRFAVRAVSSNVWARIPPILADESRWLVFGTSIGLFVAGGALIASAAMMSRQRRWSTPINTYRYSEERRWG